jgi:methylated-DNA-[protein]-cysteine S-methyltransferase
MMKLRFDELDSEIGTIVVISDDAQLVALDFAGFRMRMNQYLERRFGEFELERVIDPLGITSRLRAYFRGDYAALDAIAVDPGGTDFQHRVWTALRAIPVGETVSYGQLAARLGQPTASRAVGLANSKNPIGIVIPCHRVIGANGALTGYAGGLERKRWLLAHEQTGGQMNLPC